MKILYDHQIFEIRDAGGVSRYFYELIKNIRGQSNIIADLSIKKTNNIYLYEDPYFKEKIGKLNLFDDFISGVNFRGKKSLYEFFKKIGVTSDDEKENINASIDKIKSGNFDIFHPTYYDDYFIKYLDNKPFVLTIHDMIHEIYPEYFPLYCKDSRLKRELSRKAHKIIAISNSTKKDIIEIFGIDERKIEVIYLGNSLNFKKTVTEGPSHYIDNNFIPEKYLLFVGSRAAYKNFYFFLTAIKKILEKNKDINVVCAGGGKFSNDEINFFNSLNLRERVFNFNIVEDNFLSYLYQKAIAFVFPSLYEGFGLPILEAFFCGCPAILSNSSSLPEIAEDAAIYFNPKNINSIIEAVTEIIGNPKLRQQLKEKGDKQLKKFSWDKTVQLTKKVYESVIK